METNQYVDQVNGSCFGKYRNCQHECRLKEVCQGKKREEEREQRQKQFREARYIDEMDAESNHSAAGYRAAENRETGPEESADEIFNAIDQLDISDRSRRELRRIYRLKLERESTEDAVRELMRKMGELYIHDPTGFEVLFFQILAGGNQKLLAEKRGCTKQNINKMIAHGKRRLQAYQEMIGQKPECRLTSREIAVFHAVEIGGMTYRQTAAIIGCSFRTVGNIAQRMREKGIKLHKKRRGTKKATGKATSGIVKGTTDHADDTDGTLARKAICRGEAAGSGGEMGGE